MLVPERIDGACAAYSYREDRRADQDDSRPRRAYRGDLGDLKKTGDDIRSQFHQLETQVARTDEALKHLKERLDRSDPNERLARIEEKLSSVTRELDKLRSNRFEIGKVFLAAFFSFIGAGIFFLLNVLYQWLDKLKR